MVLLIVAALSASRLAELYQQAQARNLEVLMEVHNADELAQAQAIGANIIGINNRNLKTFKVSLQTSIELAQPEGDVIYISESGFKIGEDVEKVKHNYHGVLVGETLMRAANPVEKVRELQVRRK